MSDFERRVGEDGQPYLATHLRGWMLTRVPILNKSTAFTAEERRQLGLEGVIPPRVNSLEDQLKRTRANLERAASDLDRHIYLRSLQDRNEVLYYALLERNLEEMLPLIYTPTVAEAVRGFSRLYRFPRGLVISTENIDRIDEVLESYPNQDVRLVVATDSESILGIGDQGCGGVGICIGKLSLYTAAAGIDPSTTLPIGLDVGTDRGELLDDPLYLGVRHGRLVGAAYDDFLERFVTAFAKRFKGALLQWEDFSKQKAFDVLERFQERVPSFNDDVQGTGAVVLAGLLAAGRKTGRSLTEEVFLVHGAGAGGIGVAGEIAAGLERHGLSREQALARIFVVDSRGLILKGRPGLEPYKREFARDPAVTAGWPVAGQHPTMLETIRHGGVTALMGLSGQGGAFDRDVVTAVAANTTAPIVFALSNPTDASEAVPADVYQWSDGRAIVATGSPFGEVQRAGQTVRVGQGNNAFIFPGLGLGVMLAKAKCITRGMLGAAADALARFTSQDDVERGSVYPRIAELRAASSRVAVAVIEQALAEGLAEAQPVGETAEWVRRSMWEPRYLPIRKA